MTLLTRDMALAEVTRALKECYPDRWEALLLGLGIFPLADFEGLVITRHEHGNAVVSKLAKNGTVITLPLWDGGMFVLDELQILIRPIQQLRWELLPSQIASTEKLSR